MRNIIIKSFSRLASEAYQNRYVLNGTADSYATCEDLVNEPFSAAEGALWSGISIKLFTEKEKAALKKFMRTVNEEEEEWERIEKMNKDTVLISPEWKRLVSAAQECLLALGVERGEWDEIAENS